MAGFVVHGHISINHLVFIIFFLKGDFEIKVDLESDTLRDVTLRLSLESGIPAPVLHVRSLMIMLLRLHHYMLMLIIVFLLIYYIV